MDFIYICYLIKWSNKTHFQCNRLFYEKLCIVTYDKMPTEWEWKVAKSCIGIYFDRCWGDSKKKTKTVLRESDDWILNTMVYNGDIENDVEMMTMEYKKTIQVCLCKHIIFVCPHQLKMSKVANDSQSIQWHTRTHTHTERSNRMNGMFLLLDSRIKINLLYNNGTSEICLEASCASSVQYSFCSAFRAVVLPSAIHSKIY